MTFFEKAIFKCFDSSVYRVKAGQIESDELIQLPRFFIMWLTTRSQGDGIMSLREGETIERKEVTVDDIKKEIIAFANCDGGKLYIGIRDDGTEVGLSNSNEAFYRSAI